MYFLNKNLLVSSSILTFFNLITPGFAMKEDEGERNNPSNYQSNIPSKKEDKNKEEVVVEKKFFVRTTYGNLKFDAKTWQEEFLQSKEQEKKNELFKILEEAAFSGNDEALQKLYFFSTKAMLNINKVDTKKANEALDLSLKYHHSWAFKEVMKKIATLEKKLGGNEIIIGHIKEKNEDANKNKKTNKSNNNKTIFFDLTLCENDYKEFVSLHLALANAACEESNLANSEKFLDKLFPFNAKDWFDNTFMKRLEKIETLIIELKKIRYYKHFWELNNFKPECSLTKASTQLLKSFSNQKKNFLIEAGNLGYVNALLPLAALEEDNCSEARKWLEKLSMRRHAGAVKDLAYLYATGHGGKIDTQKAYTLLTELADRGNEGAITTLALQFWLCDGPQKDEARGFKELSKLMEKKLTDTSISTDIYSGLGKCYARGMGVSQDAKKAFEFFKKGADLKDTDATYELARLYEMGWGTEKDTKTAIFLLKHLPDVEYDLGKLHCTQGSWKEAFECFSKAAQVKKSSCSCPKFSTKNYAALYNLFVLYSEGKGCKQDLEKALKCLQEAAKGGLPTAHFVLGGGYLFGEEDSSFRIKKDLNLAKKHLETAHASNRLNATNHLLAKCYLAFLYLQEENYQKSFKFFQKAADEGDKQALFNTGILLLKGIEGEVFKEKEEDDSRAISYIQQSAAKGWSPAMIELALYYLERENDTEEGKKNLETAYFWLEKARILKNSQAEVLLKEIQKKNEISSQTNKEEFEEDFSEVTPEFSECLNKIETVNIDNKNEFYKELHIESKKLYDFSNEVQKDEVSSSEEEQETPPIEEQENLSEMELKQEKPFFHNKKRTQNPKLVRENLRKARLSFKNQQMHMPNVKANSPTEDSIKIIEKLRDPIERAKIKLNELRILFSDPYFSKNGRIEMDKTTNGWKIIGTHYKSMNSCFADTDTKEVFTTGTHRKHKKSYKGFDFNFLENIEKILKMFEV